LAGSPLRFTRLIANLWFGRKAKPCSAEAAPTGQPASAKVGRFASDPRTKTYYPLQNKTT